MYFPIFRGYKKFFSVSLVKNIKVGLNSVRACDISRHLVAALGVWDVRLSVTY